MKYVGIVAVGIVREGVPNIFRAPMYRVHCAVIFAIPGSTAFLLACQLLPCESTKHRRCSQTKVLHRN